ncbi:MAG: protein-L-isoaspartate O-methyltransferase [Methylococcaceae bacterium TMED69]|nr:MAG: protein-L-isoaspartate O-methyltransferase [Methylococcaceae bacterium TMED69]
MSGTNKIQGIGMTSQRSRNRLVSKLREMGIKNEKVLDIVAETPRHIFIEEALASKAYENSALPIGYGQTISQPFIVALMTQVLIESGQMRKVLEIGFGSGYQTAILSRVSGQVFGVERLSSLVERAREKIWELKISNIHLRHGDGMMGWEGHSPYDAILVAAAPSFVPEELLNQLSEGGRLIIPIGINENQKLMLYSKTDNEIVEKEIQAVKFVPLLPGIN